MKCPICPDVDLVMSERSGVEIDYCPKCRGVWLDRGELDKIIEKNSSHHGSGHGCSDDDKSHKHGEGCCGGDDKHKGEQKRYQSRYEAQGESKQHGKHKKKNFLMELFDFD